MSEKGNEFNRAMDKVRDEMAREGCEVATNMLGELATLLLFASPEAASAMLDPKKSLGGVWTNMKDWAGKHRTGNSAVVTPDKALEIICDYYGVTNPGMSAILGAYAGTTIPKSQQGKTETEAQTFADVPDPVDPFDLDALLGGL